jgi:tetratricopeptide (TPR) repeat protein
MTRPADLEETAPATGLSCTPGDWGFPPGTLAGRYVLGERLGAGGMGIVYAAHDERLDREVALKLLRPDAAGGGDAHTQLVREAQTLARLAHPNVVSVHDIGDFEGRVYVEMELVKGSTLAQWLRAGDREWQQVLDVFVQAGRGLAAAHAVGIVHRDFKPDNVLVGDDGRVRVADFGIALLGRHGRDDSGPDAVVDSADRAVAASERGPSDERSSYAHALIGSGTPGYMAPEQKGEGPADARSDQYSFCVALYEAMHGVKPTQKAAAGAPCGRDLKPPTWLDEATARGLATSPGERYPAMEMLLELLAREPRRRRGRRRAAAGVAAGIGLLLAGIVSGSVASRSAGARSPQLCPGAEAKLAGVWDDGRKADAQRAFLATGKPFATDAWHGASATLDAYARDWVAGRAEACEASRVRGEQSDQLLGLRMACLDERLEALGALAEVFARADDRVVAHAFEAAQALSRVASCGDPRWLLASVKRPRDPRTAADVAALQARIAGVKALHDLGKYPEALPLARDIAAEALQVSDPGVQAAALYHEGMLLGRTGDLHEADRVLRRAASLADASGDDALRVRALGALLFFVAGDDRKVDRIGALEEEAKGALARLGGDDDAEANFLMGLGAALEEAGRHGEARDADEKVAAVEERLHGRESWQEAIALVNLGSTLANLGEVEPAIELEERAVTIVERELGPAHPSVADAEATIAISLLGEERPALAEPHMRRAIAITDGVVSAEEFVAYLYGMGDVLIAEGKLDEALAQFQRALDMLSSSHPADDPVLRISLTGVGEIYLDSGKPALGTAYLERALALPSDGDPAFDARTKFALARALRAARSSQARARALAADAKQTLEKSGSEPGDAKRLREIDQWLAANP